MNRPSEANFCGAQVNDLSSRRHHRDRGTVRAPGVVVSTPVPIRHYTLRGATL